MEPQSNGSRDFAEDAMTSWKLVAGVILAPLIATSPLLIDSAWAQTVSIITTPAGSFSNSGGAAMAKVVTEKARLRMIVQAQASTGFDEVDAGSVEFNVSNSFHVTFIVTGTGDYEGQAPKRNIRYVASMVPYRVAMHVRADSDIRTIADLKGKRVSAGFNAQKTIGRIIEAHLANAGLSYKDVVGVPTPNVVSQANDFKAGKVDVMFFALGSAAIKEAAATVGGLRVLAIDDSAEAQKRMQAVLPGAYVLTVNPAPGIDGISQPTKLIAFDMVLNSSTHVADDIIYRAVKALHDNRADLAATFPPFGLFEPSRMGKPVQGVELHPGAARFYKEARIAPKS
jgi:TRAP transporter TAXI family solute receptor